MEVEPDATHVTTTVEYLVEFSALDTFRIQVPASIERLQIDPVDVQDGDLPIKEKTAGDPEDGWITWTVVTQGEVLGIQRFVLR